MSERNKEIARAGTARRHARDGQARHPAGITIERFEDGKVVEAWRSMDTLALLREIGAIPKAWS